jgi:hypothetical protein
MSYTPEELIKITANYEELVNKSIVIEAKKKGKFPFWLMKNKKKVDKKDNDSNKANDKKKPDPSAAVRNRGTVCVSAESAKDKKEHYPINDADQARNALSQVAKYTTAPPWYNGSLKSLQDLVSRKVHSKYPSIGKKDKKSSTDYLLAKYGQDSHAFYNLVRNYDSGAEVTKDFAEAMKMSADAFGQENDLEDQSTRKIYSTLIRQANLVFELVPEMESLDREMESATSGSPETIDEESPTTASFRGVSSSTMNKYASVNEVVSLLNNYNSTAEFLRDVAKAQFELSGLDQENPEHQQDEAYESSKVLHDIIMECANKIQPIEEATW